MGQIVRAGDGAYHCNGRYCGYPLAWHPPSIEDNEPGLWVCLDCNASMYAEGPTAAEVYSSLRKGGEGD